MPLYATLFRAAHAHAPFAAAHAQQSTRWSAVGALLYSPAHKHHIKRGGGTGPMKPRQPPRTQSEEGANSSRCRRFSTKCLEDVGKSSITEPPPPSDPAEVFS